MRPALAVDAAGDDLDQRGFAGAVVAEERHHLAALDVEADAAQRLDRPEMLGNAFEPEQRRGAGCRRLAHRRHPTLLGTRMCGLKLGDFAVSNPLWLPRAPGIASAIPKDNLR